MSDLQSVVGALVLSARRFPNCPVANCDCHHKDRDEWQKGCHCLCHLLQMSRKFRTAYSLADVEASAKAGKPRLCPGPKPGKKTKKKARKG